jgi:hypothetical protein
MSHGLEHRTALRHRLLFGLKFILVSNSSASIDAAISSYVVEFIAGMSISHPRMVFLEISPKICIGK